MAKLKRNIEKHALERAFQAYLTDFNACRQEIILEINLQNQMMNYAIAIVAGTVTLFALDQQNVLLQSPFILLISSLLLSAINWALIEASLAIANLASYLQYTLTPKIRLLVDQNGQLEFDGLRWEEYQASKNRNVPWAIMGVGKHAISYIPSIVFIIIFYFTKIQAHQAWNLGEILLFGFAVLATLALPTMSLFKLRARGKQKQV